MLNPEQYNELWDIHFSGITNQNCPDFEQYIIRENMLEDYLDLFRGVNTRNQRAQSPANWYYEHPFFNVNGNSALNEKPCIKYILIAEACPENNTNYFYDVREISGQTYLRVVYNASYNDNHQVINWQRLNNINDKIDKLISLASRGVLLLDIFPFALKYNSNLRTIINESLVTNSFWNNIDNYYSIENRLFSLSQFLFENWDLSMMAPNIISEYILNPNNGMNTIQFPFSIMHSNNFRDINNNPLRPTNWRKNTIDTSYNPNSTLITISFN
jgi:hypothetical protein